MSKTPITGSPPAWWSQPTGITPEQAKADAEQIIVHAITHHPRSLQKTIGPSEIGTPCDHCLAARLAGWEQRDAGIPWVTTIGTAMHLWLEDTFNRAEWDRPEYASPDAKHRYLTEQKITVGTIAGTPITGSTDLVDLEAGMVIDWKNVSTTSLRKYRHGGPPAVYQTQAHLYAHGWNQAGVQVDTVAICFLPRTSNKWSDHYWWTATYDEQVAVGALERANRFATQITTLRSLTGSAGVDRWISGLPRADGCYSCARYPDWQPPEKTVGGITIDIPTNNKMKEKAS